MQINAEDLKTGEIRPLGSLKLGLCPAAHLTVIEMISPRLKFFEYLIVFEVLIGYFLSCDQSK